MPLRNQLIDPRFFEKLGTTFWKHTCTIQTPPETFNEIGEPELAADAGWVNLPGHDLISCNLAAQRALGEQQSEKRNAGSTYDAKTRHCQLNGYYPLITEGMRAVVDSVAYDIRGVVHSSAKVQTKLILERIT